jgi:hypothetical protein
MSTNLKFTALAEPYKRQCGNITFIVSSFANPNTNKTAEDLILHMLEGRIYDEECEEK